jgi:hypothetical protein
MLPSRMFDYLYDTSTRFNKPLDLSRATTSPMLRPNQNTAGPTDMSC